MTTPIFTAAARDTSEMEAELAAGKAALAIFNGDRETALADLHEAHRLLQMAIAMDKQLADEDLKDGDLR